MRVSMLCICVCGCVRECCHVFQCVRVRGILGVCQCGAFVCARVTERQCVSGKYVGGQV